jgi:20S proteasome subunit alpha 6
MSPHDLAHH